MGKKKWYDVAWLCMTCRKRAAEANKQRLPADLAETANKGGVGTTGRSWAVFTDDPESELKQKSPSVCPHCKGRKFTMEIRAVPEREWENYDRKHKKSH